MSKTCFSEEYREEEGRERMIILSRSLLNNQYIKTKFVHNYC